MPSLSSSIVNQKVASVRDVEEALSRQALYGGDLITNLLELATISEEHLTRVLAGSHELEPAPAGELPVSPESVRRLVPGDLAQRFALYPLEEREGALTLAVAEPLPAETEQDLSFSLGAKIVQKIALLVRVRQAIARDYGAPLDRRSLRVIARLSGKPDPSPSSLPSSPAEQLARRAPRTVGPSGAANAGASAPTPSGPSSALDSRQAVAEPLHVPRAPAMPDFSSLTRPAATRARRLGPVTAAMAERSLNESESRDDVLSAFFDFASQYFDYSALFAVHGDLAEGRDAAGAGAPRARIVGVGVPLDLPSAMSRARDSSGYEVTRLDSGGLDGALAKDLERRPGRLVLFLPVQVRNRTVLILYGDHGDRDLELTAVGDVISFAPLVAQALERLILRKRLRDKQQGEVVAPVNVPSRRREAAAPRPTVSERAATLASMIEGVGAQNSSPAPVLQDALAPTLAMPMVSVTPTSRRSEPSQARSSYPAPPARSSEPPEDGWDDAESAPPSKPSAPAVLETARAPEAEATAHRSGPLPRLQLVPEALPSLPAPAPADEPEIDISESPGALYEYEASPISSGVPLAPASRSVAYSARPLPLRDLSQDVGLPSVIVDLANDTQELVERLLAGDQSAGEKLAQIGDTAITVLASIFPGPITAELRRGSGEGQGKASECGPVLRTLARMGTRPVPFVAVRTADGDPVVRAWATRLLGEMPSAESAQAVVRRLTDDDPDVQRAALAAGHLLLQHPDAGEALQAKIAETVSDVTRPEDSRHTLIEALAELRAPLVIPKLIRLLEDGSPDIVRSAYWALGVISRQDFGTKAALWEQWWHANGSRHRIEWLIDSLMHENQELRRHAGDELKSLTKEYFGYYDDLPKKERERAQERYRQWWEAKGKGRFR